MPRLIALVGPPGSGKTTYRQKLIDKNINGNYLYLNQDEQGKHHLDLLEAGIEDKLDIIVDRMNFNKEQRERYLKPAREAGYTSEIFVIHENKKTCMDRMLKREGHPTIKTEKDASSALNMFFKLYERPTEDEADIITFKYPEGAKEFAIWVDIDNTLADNSHRVPILKTEPKKTKWKRFFDEMDKDIPNNWCVKLINGMLSQCKVLICSARPDDYRQKTKEWLEKNYIQYDELIMRPRGDFRSDEVIKEIMYEFEVKTRYNLLFSVDDRKQVIDMMRSHNVQVLDCAGPNGEF